MACTPCSFKETRAPPPLTLVECITIRNYILTGHSTGSHRCYDAMRGQEGSSATPSLHWETALQHLAVLEEEQFSDKTKHGLLLASLLLVLLFRMLAL